MEYVEQIDMLIGRFRVTLRRENGATVVTIGASQFLNECAAFVQNKRDKSTAAGEHTYGGGGHWFQFVFLLSCFSNLQQFYSFAQFVFLQVVCLFVP